VIVCLDANIVIYHVERHPVWEPKVTARLKALATSGDAVAVSDAARMECLVGPLQSGNASVLADYQQFFGSAGIQLLLVTAAVWERAAQIRARFKLQSLDSIHLASAIEHGCGLFLTNDAQLARCLDRAGHLAIFGRLSRWQFLGSGGEGFHQRVEFGFEFCPSRLPSVLAAFLQLGSGRVE
jgi:predicted nucleic acid-binding protein